MPPVPDFVTSEIGRKFWHEYGPRINALGLLEVLDAPAFAMLCEAFAALKDMRDEFDANPEYTNPVGENGALQPNPMLALISKQMKGVLELLSEFGMTPVARQKLTGSTSATPADPNADPMAALAQQANEAGSIPKPPPPPE